MADFFQANGAAWQRFHLEATNKKRIELWGTWKYEVNIIKPTSWKNYETLFLSDEKLVNLVSGERRER